MLAAGVGVAAVVAFVAALAVGGRPSAPRPGDRLGLTRAGAEGAVTVVAVRCPSERVTGVELRRPEGEVVWRIVSRKGSIDQRYPIGGDPPLGFRVDEPLDHPLPGGLLVVTAHFSREGPGGVTDRAVVEAVEVPEDGVLHRGAVVRGERFEQRARMGIDCPIDAEELDGITLAFAVAAGGVLVTYAVLVQRWWRSRRSRG